METVGIGRLDCKGFGFSDLHTEYGLLKSRDQLPLTESKLECFALFRGVENRSIRKLPRATIELLSCDLTSVHVLGPCRLRGTLAAFLMAH
jgi:hypothetical protein